MKQIGPAVSAEETVAPWPFVDRRVNDRRWSGDEVPADSPDMNVSVFDLAAQRVALRQRAHPATNWHRSYRKAVLGIDVVMVVIASLVAHVAGPLVTNGGFRPSLLAALVAPSVWVVCMSAACGYDSEVLDHPVTELKAELRALATAMLVAAAVGYLLRAEVARNYLVATVLLVAILIPIGRFAGRRVVVLLRARGKCLQRVLFIGHERSVHVIIRQAAQQRGQGLDIVGACVPSGRSDLIQAAGVPVLGDLSQALEVALREAVEVVVIAPCVEMSEGGLRRLGWALEESGIELMVSPGILDVSSPRLRVSSVCGMPTVRVTHPTFRGPRVVVKAVLDRALAGVLLLMFAPLLLALAVLIPLDSTGSPVFRQTRVGRGGSLFTVYKLRTMHMGAEARQAELLARNVNGDGLLFKVRDDPRVTRVGRWLRRTSLDELPQLVNVLLGQMSLVGPRPPLPTEVARYGQDLSRRLLVKPGVTGLWQVSGRSDLTWEESMRLDLRYVENWSLALDTLILWRTMSTVVRGAGAY